MNVQRIKVKDLDSKFIENLQVRHKSEDAELVFHVHPNAGSEILSESEFWSIISLLDWEKSGDDEAVVEPAIQHLSKLSVPKILQFEDKLSEKLFQLDQMEIASQDGENGYREGNYFSTDIFLYFRCCIIANGKEYFEKVLKKPSELTPDLTFEELLYVAHKAYKRKTGRDMEFLPLYQCETFSNKEGWKK